MGPRHKVRTEANRATDGPRHKGRARALAYIMERYGVPTTSASPLAARVFRMDRWVPLAPLRVTPVAAHVPDKEKWVEKDPDDDIPSLRGLSRKVVLQILDYVPLYDLPRVAMASRECQVLVNKEKLWKWRWDRLGWQKTNVLSDPLLDATPEPIPLPAWANPAPVPSAPSCKASKTVDLLSDLDFALDRFKVTACAEKLVHFLRPHGAVAERRVLNQLGELFWFVDDKQRRDTLESTK